MTHITGCLQDSIGSRLIKRLKGDQEEIVSSLKKLMSKMPAQSPAPAEPGHTSGLNNVRTTLRCQEYAVRGSHGMLTKHLARVLRGRRE